MSSGLSGPFPGAGFAQMTYSTNGGPEQTLTGIASTSTWYEAGEPVNVFLKLLVGDITVQFGIYPFSGTGSYSDLAYFMYIDPSLYSPDVTGLYTTVAYPPAADPPPPDFTVVTYEVKAPVTAWAASLKANLVWFDPTVTEPPLTLAASSLTLSIKPEAAASASAAGGGGVSDPDAYGREQFAAAARDRGLALDPADVPRRAPTQAG
jgi:hypothetical protein